MVVVAIGPSAARCGGDAGKEQKRVEKGVDEIAVGIVILYSVGYNALSLVCRSSSCCS